MKYQLNEVTPREMLCLGGIGCPAIYEVTPREMQCIAGLGCPAIYEETPKVMECFIGACPRIYSEEDQGHYLIVGERIDPKEFGLEEKVSQTEVLVRVPRKLIDERGK